MTSKTTNKCSSEVRDRAVRMVLDHGREHPSRGTAIISIAARIGNIPPAEAEDCYYATLEQPAMAA